MESWCARIAKNWTLVWFVLIIILSFPKAAVRISSVKVSVTNYVFGQDDSLSISSLFVVSLKIWLAWIAKKYVLVWCFFILELIFLQSYRLHFFIIMSTDKFWILKDFQLRNISFYCSQWKLDWLKIPKLAYACNSSWDWNSSVSKATDWTAFLLDEQIPIFFSIRTVMCWFWKKCDLLWCSSIVKLIPSENTCCISFIKISQASSRFSAEASEN